MEQKLESMLRLLTSGAVFVGLVALASAATVGLGRGRRRHLGLLCLLAALLAGGGIAAERRAISQMQGCYANLTTLRDALEAFALAHGGHYPAALGELVPDYLRAIPACPAAGTDTYTASYHLEPMPVVAGPDGPGEVEAPDQEAAVPRYGHYFVLACRGGHHRLLGINERDDFPSFSSLEGFQ